MAKTDGPVDLADFKEDSIVISTSYHAYSYNCLEACRTAGFEPNVIRRVHRCWGDMYVGSETHSFFLVPRDDSGRLAPTSISGLVTKKLANQNTYLKINAVYPKDSNTETVVVAENMKKVSEIMQAEREARKAANLHTQTALP